MLSAVFHARDPVRAWVAGPDGWTAGRNAIRPFLHPSLHAALFASPRRAAVVVRERIRGAVLPPTASTHTLCSENEFDQAMAEARKWPLDFMVLEISRPPGGTEVRLQCGHWGTAPVYLLARDGTLRVDWDITKLYPHLRSTAVDPRAAAEYVFGLDCPYSRRTLFPGIQRLTERATAVWKPPHRRVAVIYPHPASRATAGELVRGADVEGMFRAILSASMRRWTGAEEGAVALEFSGGLDSSIVAASAAAISRTPVRSFGLLLPGRSGGHQRARRAAVVRRFGLIDRTLHAIDHPPFAPESRRIRERASAPSEEFYAEAMGALVGLATAAGASSIFTGMGGDELCSLQAADFAGDRDDQSAVASTGPAAAEPPVPRFATAALREAAEQRDEGLDPAPCPLLHTSAIESAAAVSTLYLRAGVWPVSPLCTPELVEFCRRLPQAWRRERTLHRKVLTSFGCPRRVAYPRPETLEHFGGVMAFALRDAAGEAIEALFRESRLADQGLVDRAALAKTYAQVRAGDETQADFVLGTVMVELALRSAEHHRSKK